MLKVHGKEMPSSINEAYLGDIISSNGRNKVNLEDRKTKGIGKTSEILCIVNKISLGRHFFKIALILRETLFLSSILTNSEVWYNLSETDLNDINMLDRKLLAMICSLPISTPTAALYLELGCMRISTIIKARRVNYLHYLIKLKKDEMLSQFFWFQWFENCRYDWTYQVRQDLIDFGLPTDVEIIGMRSKLSWKNVVRKKAKEFELKELLNENVTKSKTKDLKYVKLDMQEYLRRLDANKAKVVMKYRLKMASYASNFKGGGGSKVCPLCSSHEDDQRFCFKCPGIDSSHEYEDIFADNVTSEVAAKLEEIERKRSKCC